MTSAQNMFIRFNNHTDILKEAMERFQQENAFSDVTLVAERQKLRVNRMFLAAFSPYFEDILKDFPDNPVVILTIGVTFASLKLLVEYIYCGAVNIPSEHVRSLLLAAEQFEVKGLGDSLTGGHAPSKEPFSFQHSNPKRPAEEAPQQTLSTRVSCHGLSSCGTLPPADTLTQQSGELSSLNDLQQEPDVILEQVISPAHRHQRQEDMPPPLVPPPPTPPPPPPTPPPSSPDPSLSRVKPPSTPVQEADQSTVNTGAVVSSPGSDAPTQPTVPSAIEVREECSRRGGTSMPPPCSPLPQLRVCLSRLPMLQPQLSGPQAMDVLQTSPRPGTPMPFCGFRKPRPSVSHERPSPSKRPCLLQQLTLDPSCPVHSSLRTVVDRWEEDSVVGTTRPADSPSPPEIYSGEACSSPSPPLELLRPCSIPPQLMARGSTARRSQGRARVQFSQRRRSVSPASSLNLLLDDEALPSPESRTVSECMWSRFESSLNSPENTLDNQERIENVAILTAADLEPFHPPRARGRGRGRGRGRSRGRGRVSITSRKIYVMRDGSSIAAPNTDEPPSVVSSLSE